MGHILDIVNKILPIVQDRMEKTGEDYKVLIKEELEKEKNLSETDQSKQIDSKNNLNNILPPGVDLDNGQVFSEETGDTLGDVEEVLK